MSYANHRLSNPVDCRICRTLFGFLTAPLVLLITAGAFLAL
jgi:hypothetical protein